MFDPNQMAELAAISRDRYQRNGGGGAFKVYATSKAYYDARGWNELSKFEQTCLEMLHRYRTVCAVAKAQFKQDCYDWERDSVEARCPYVQARKRWGLSDDIPF